MQQYFEKEYGRKTKYIPNGVNKPEIFEADIIKKEYGVCKDEYILFLGRLVPEKGVKYLVEAFKNINTDKKLIIAGGSSDTTEYMNELMELAQNDRRIIFTGFVQGRHLEELYSNAYLYCLPSDLEGMPLSLLEAMSYGNCCLVSDIEECSSVIEDKGLCFHKGNIADLKKKLEFLINNNLEVNRYKNEATDFICSKYNWDSVVEQTLDIYREEDYSHSKLSKRALKEN